MSDEDDVRTFWFKCSRGHVAESPLLGDGMLLLCNAQLVRGPGITLDVCGEELRLHGPSVGEWRAAKAEGAEAKAHGEARVAHLERMLGEADAALASCSTQLDRAMSNEGDWGHQVDVANEAALKLAAERDSALAMQEVANRSAGDALRQRDAAVREVGGWETQALSALRERDAALAKLADAEEARELPVRERDDARSEAVSHHRALVVLRHAVLCEAERLDERGRHKAANRLREHVTDSYPGVELGPLPRLQAERGGVRFSTPSIAEQLRAEEALAAELAADPLVSNVEMRLTKGGEEEVFHRPKSPEVATIVDGRLVTVLGAPFPEWQAAAHEVMRHGVRGTHTGTIPAAIQSMVAELRELREDARRRKRLGQGFTVVRDVNQQTEAARDRAMAELLATRDELRAAKHVAEWAVSSLTNVPHDYPAAALAFRRAVDAEAESGCPAAPMVYDPALIDALHDLEARFGGLGVRRALASIEAAR